MLVAIVIATVLFASPDSAHADLLGGLTDAVDETVESVESTLDETVDDGLEVVDDTVGSTNTVLDEPVDALTDAIAATADELTDVVEDTADTVTDTVDAVAASTGAEILPTEEEPPTTTSTSTTTTTTAVVGASVREAVTPSRETTPTAVLESGDDSAIRQPEADRAVVPAGRSGQASAASSSDRAPTGSFSAGSLTVLSAAGGLIDPGTFEPVVVSPAFDPSLYGRLLEWLSSVGPGMLTLLAGPLLALEIVIRALVSAGSGLVAPLSLLGAYLAHLIWESRPTSRLSSPA